MMKNNDDKIIFIAWESHRRTIELCKHFGIKLEIMSSAKSRILKHPLFIFRTICILYKYKMKCLMVQNPSLVLSLIGCVFKNIIGYLLIVDAHNAAIIPEGILQKNVIFLYDYIIKRADITIVTNEALADIVKSRNGNPYVLPDKLPTFDKKLPMSAPTGSFDIACISTFNIDEPYEVIIAAAKLMPYVNIFMTGDFKKIHNNIIRNKSNNVIFTGYLSDDNYWKLLCSVKIIIDLTYRDNCLVCGAYEAAAVGTPAILSDTAALRNYFQKGFMFTENSVIGVVNSVNYAINNFMELNNSIAEFKYQIEVSWEAYAKNLFTLLKKIRAEI